MCGRRRHNHQQTVSEVTSWLRASPTPTSTPTTTRTVPAVLCPNWTGHSTHSAPETQLRIDTLERLGRSTHTVLAVAAQLQTRRAELRVLDLGGNTVDTSTATGSMLFTTLAALTQMERELKRERAHDSIERRRHAGKSLGGRPLVFTDDQIRRAVCLVEGGQPAAKVAFDLGMSRATFYRRSRALDD